MSVVANVMVSHSVLEESPILACKSRDWWLPLKNTCDFQNGDAWGGNKWPECDVWAGAYNFLDLEATLALLASIPWREPENVQVFVRLQEDDRFVLYELFGGTFRIVGRGHDW